MRKKVLYSILFLSICFNFFVLLLDTVPFLEPKIVRKFSNEEISNTMSQQELEKSIVDRALEMIKSDKVASVWAEPSGFTEIIFNYIKNGTQTSFKMYHYPRAYLYYALSEYYKRKNDMKGLGEFKKYFDKLMNHNGEPIFVLDKVDQAPFGLAALNLYTVYKDDKYRKFYKAIYQFLLSKRNPGGIILYRENSDNQFYDVLGMIVPFLVRYFQISSDYMALEIAKNQMDFYIKYGLDKETFIPSHGISLVSKIKTGSSNWGRGIGWYLLGLSSLHHSTGQYEKELSEIYESLNTTRTKDGLFSQFPGSSFEFDASTSTMFLYAFSFLDKTPQLTKAQILSLLSPYIDKDGSIKNTSGDTHGLNSYSHSFGYCELSQGMLILLLSNEK